MQKIITALAQKVDQLTAPVRTMMPVKLSTSGCWPKAGLLHSQPAASYKHQHAAHDMGVGALFHSEHGTSLNAVQLPGRRGGDQLPPQSAWASCTC